MTKKKLINVEYSHTNSGGSWWLKDKDWKALEKAGWTVKWFKDKKDSCQGRGRFLDALATHAFKKFIDIKEAIQEFERITGMTASDEGCNCCGAPHSFSWEEGKEHHYCSGDQVVKYLYDEVPTDYRDAVEKLNARRI